MSTTFLQGSKTEPLRATISKRYALTKDGSSKETHHIDIEMLDCDLDFCVGDSIAIFTENDYAYIEIFLKALGKDGSEEVLEKRSKETYALKDLLLKKLNLSRLTTGHLNVMREAAISDEDISKLDELLLPENKSAFLKEHEPLDLLRMFPTVHPELQSFISHFGPLLPRFYSIASSPKISHRSVGLTVSVSKFQHQGVNRMGVASHYLCHTAQLGETKIKLYVQPSHGFAPPEDPTTPIIMIGPGTGVAPFRGFMQERASHSISTKNWLFFGERNRKTDYYYQEEWESYVERGVLKLSTAFSRDEKHSVYVQHRLEEHADEVWKWIEEGAHIYVCGDAHRMAKDVEATLNRIAASMGRMSEEEARNFFKRLRKEKRYLLDVY